MSIDLTLIGGRGYTGELLLGLIEGHPEFRIARVGSRSLAGRRLSDVFPQLGTDLRFERIEPGDDIAADGVILALANGESAPFVEWLSPEKVVVDLSADHRFDPDWWYGLPELNRAARNGMHRIANPGCYATAVQLALAPLAAAMATPPVAFGVSGYSGAGRTPSPRNDPQRLADNLLPYQLTGHVHETEVSHQLGREVRFMPHVAGFFRGISVTAALELDDPTDAASLAQRYRTFYHGEPLVQVSEEVPEIRAIAHRPGAIVGGFAVDQRDPRRVTVVAVIDNLLKGAASQALQNLNLAFGLDELSGLEVSDG